MIVSAPRLPWPPAGPPTYLFLALGALLGTATVLTRATWLVPICQTALAYVVLWRDLGRGDLGAAVRHMLFWAVCVSLATIQFAILAPEPASVIFHGEAYRDEMFAYIETGIGPEGSPRQFVPQHILHYGSTLAISALTAGLGGLFLGSLLLDYMNYYVGSLVRLGQDPTLGALVGWPIWSYLRVAGFICGAIASAHFALARILRRTPWRPRAFRTCLGWSVALFLLDIALKWTLASLWRGWLERALLG